MKAMGQFGSVAVQFGGITKAGLAGSAADLLIVENGVTTGFVTLPPADIAALAAGGQTIIAYVNTSVTDATRSYWQAEWVAASDPSEGDVGTVSAAAPAWLQNNLGGVDFYPGHAGPDALIADYRSADWRALVIAQAGAQIMAGYGGVFLDDVGRYFEAGYHGGGPFDRSLADAMMQLVIDVAAAVRAINPAAVVVVNAGISIGGDSTDGTAGALFAQYRAAIDGVLIENQFNAANTAVLDLARSLYSGKDIIALESLARAPNVEALLGYAADNGILLQLAPDEGYDDAVHPPRVGTFGADTLQGAALAANTIGGGSGSDVLTGGTLGDVIYGHAGADKIGGALGADRLGGGAGHDMLYGGAGNDKLYGGDDKDSLFGDSGNDICDGGLGNDVIYGGSQNDIVTGASGNDRLYGGSQNDRIYGSSGTDYLYGGSGNDILGGGGTGNDYLHGGTGRDVFVFEAAVGRARIADFDQGADRVDLRAYDAAYAKVKAALHIAGGIVQLDLGALGGSGHVDFLGEQKLSSFTASDFIL